MENEIDMKILGSFDPYASYRLAQRALADHESANALIGLNVITLLEQLTRVASKIDIMIAALSNEKQI